MDGIAVEKTQRYGHREDVFLAENLREKEVQCMSSSSGQIAQCHADETGEGGGGPDEHVCTFNLGLSPLFARYLLSTLMHPIPSQAPLTQTKMNKK